MQPWRHIALVNAVLGTFVLAGCQSKPADSEATPVTRAPAASGWPIRLNSAELHEFLETHADALLIDVRDFSEWNDDVGHIEGSRRIPLSQLGGRLTEIEEWKHKPVITISRLGDRGGAAALVLREAGFTKVTSLDGGLEAWRKAGF